MDEQLQQEDSLEMSLTDEMSDDDIAAALGFASTIQEGMLPQDDMTTAEGEAVEEPVDAPMEAEEEVSAGNPEETPSEENETTPEGDIKPTETDILSSRLDTLEMEIERLKNKDDETG